MLAASDWAERQRFHSSGVQGGAGTAAHGSTVGGGAGDEGHTTEGPAAARRMYSGNSG